MVTPNWNTGRRQLRPRQKLSSVEQTLGCKLQSGGVAEVGCLLSMQR
jgi:hypothetical protein